MILFDLQCQWLHIYDIYTHRHIGTRQQITTGSQMSILNTEGGEFAQLGMQVLIHRDRFWTTKPIDQKYIFNF